MGGGPVGFLLSHFPVSFMWNRCYFSFRCFTECTSKDIWFWNFLWGEGFIKKKSH